MNQPNREQLQFPMSLPSSGATGNLSNFNNFHNNYQTQSNAREQIQTGLNSRQSVASSSMNYPIHHNAMPFMDRAIQSQNQPIPVQSNMHTSYEFDKLNFMNLPSNHGIMQDNKPLDTRRQNYENTKQNDDLYYKNHQGNLYNFFDNKPAHTRLSENTQNPGLDMDLLPKKTMNLPKDKL